MTMKNTITRMGVDLLNGVTSFTVSVTEDLGIATRVRGTFDIRIDQKFETIGPEANAAVNEFMAKHAAELGLE